ncbi:hypothetical protein S40285_05564 [Stachybotrys chlorohalonatus IBT 40285]|uniref:4'-phosphopantetheinyl transferase domain-containing protein n=1 Tax=Stachybotrys chlorohalonatus (strain IBT 40285) TaxID=1283841 RepID=A0A084QEX7_STAC4|nr:hypothetical protein S40285_05564 [Stachybotrys chlorohalonata IBT 40285]
MKPLRPFPLPLSVGTDICQISRVFRILDGPRGSRFVNRILSPEEQSRLDPRAQLKSSNDGLHPRYLAGGNQVEHMRELAELKPELWKTAMYVAGRFAAKEAAIKAHPHRRLTFHDIVIERIEQEGSRLGSGPPVARIKSEGEAEEDESALISISHDGDYATAVCIGAAPVKT